MSHSDKTIVYLADLRHNFSGVLSVDAMPLGIGYMKAVMDLNLPEDEVEVRIFAYPDELLIEMNKTPPDILMVGNYVWNEALGHFFLRQFKKVNPDGLAVMGGPNFPVEPQRQIDYVASYPEIDLYLVGEADFTAMMLVERYMECQGDIHQLLQQELPAAIYRKNGQLIRTEILIRNKNVDEIPSPYLTGIMDRFFDGKLSPMIETNRGCPFHCSFCVQGTQFYNRVTYFDLQRLRDEIFYIANCIKKYSPDMGTFRLADPNYGMYKRDVDIAEYIGEVQRDFSWPTFIDATTGKNKPERIIECLEKMNGVLVLYQAVQSLDDEVLRNINRSNIKLSSYEKIMIHVRGRGLRSNSDLILGLPGETINSHLTGMYQLIDADTDQAHCFQAMVLKGSELESAEMREKYQFDTRFRVLPKNYGIYNGEKVFDTEEIIVGTKNMSFDDYLNCRKHHMTFSIFWNDSWFDDVVKMYMKFGIKRSEWLQAMLEAMEEDTGPVNQLLNDFVDETTNELFPDRQSCVDFYSQAENFERLKRGEIGDNLMYKYRAKASFFSWEMICEMAMNKTREMLLQRGIVNEMPDFEAFWKDFYHYVEARHASGQVSEQVLAPVHIDLSYDIKAWIDEGYSNDISAYKLQTPRSMLFHLSEEGYHELEAAFDVWSNQLVGLTKLVTRIRISSQVRDVEWTA